MSTKLVLVLFCGLTSVFGRKGYGPTDQKWGYVNVREGAHMFWWLHHTTVDVSNFIDRPLVIWLQGEGSSSGYGNFAQVGPLDENLKVRPSAWTNDVNVLFVDNPVGTGFSYVDHNDYLVKNNKQIADDFLVFIKEFFKENPEFSKTPMYIFSEFYGGKMTVEIALTIDKATKAGELVCNLTGVALGDPLISPADTIQNYAPYLLNLGLIDKIAYSDIAKAVAEVNQYMDKNNYSEANDQQLNLLGFIFEETHGIGGPNVLDKVSANENSSKMEELNRTITGIMNNVVKPALKLNSTWEYQSCDMVGALKEDFMKPVTDLVEKLLNTTHIKVAVYNGQLDLLINTPGTVAWVDKLKWSQKSTWETVSQQPLINRGYVEGFYKKVGNLALYLVERAGHRVPADNPQGMEAILKDVTGNYKV